MSWARSTMRPSTAQTWLFAFSIRGASGKVVAQTSPSLHLAGAHDDMGEARPRVVELQRLLADLGPLLDGAGQHVLDQRCPAGETVVQGADGDPGFAGDLLQPRVEPLLAEHFARGRPGHRTPFRRGGVPGRARLPQWRAHQVRCGRTDCGRLAGQGNHRRPRRHQRHADLVAGLGRVEVAVINGFLGAAAIRPVAAIDVASMRTALEGMVLAPLSAAASGHDRTRGRRAALRFRASAKNPVPPLAGEPAQLRVQPQPRTGRQGDLRRRAHHRRPHPPERRRACVQRRCRRAARFRAAPADRLWSRYTERSEPEQTAGSLAAQALGVAPGDQPFCSAAGSGCSSRHCWPDSAQAASACIWMSVSALSRLMAVLPPQPT